jgi:hypothetical protein
MTIDWQQLRTEYEAGASLRQLERKYGVSKSVIGQRKYQEHWTQEKEARTPTGNPKHTTRDVNAAVRVQAAIKLRLEQSLSWDEVAAQAGYASRGAAHNAVMRELERCITHDVKQLRDQELYMLQQLQARCYKAATDDGNGYWTFAIDRFVALSKRKSELMGLDIAKDANVAANMVVVREIPQGYLQEPKQ